MNKRCGLKTILLAGSMFAGLASTAIAGPTDYDLLTTIAVPATGVNSQGGAMTAFDISYVDPITGDYYFADRSNASVDIINGATDQFLAQAGGFAGQQMSTSISGPDGVLVVDNGTTATLYAGDAGSTLRSFNVTNPAAPVALGTLNTGGGADRVDEMSYSPTANLLMVANNANSPAFATLVNATPPTPTVAQGDITVPGQAANGGMEQSVWDPKTGTFFVSIPSFNGTNDAGGVAQISTSGTVINTYNFTSMGISSCSPAGLGLGASGNLMVGCATAGTQTVVLNPTANSGAGAIVTRIGTVSGTDELWYDAAAGDFYVTGVNASGDRVIAVISDAGYATLQSIDLTSLGFGKVNAHSVAVDPLNNDIFVPLEGTVGAAVDPDCPGGCVAVFAETVPEPETLTLLVVGLFGLGGVLGARRRAFVTAAPKT